MRIAKRRISCCGCRGLHGSYSRGVGPYCAYGFATWPREVETPIPITKSGKVTATFPLEPCPRPRTYDEHVDA
jgi:hypothetical protein